MLYNPCAGFKRNLCYNTSMNLVCTPYQCRECDNISWRSETCHGKPMEPLCYCGSGRFAVDCHGVQDHQTNFNQTAS